MDPGLLDAVDRGDAARVAALLLAGREALDPEIDLAAKGNRAIRLAARRGHAEVVRLLLADPEIDPAAKNNRAIGLAALCGHAEVVCASSWPTPGSTPLLVPTRRFGGPRRVATPRSWPSPWPTPG